VISVYSMIYPSTKIGINRKKKEAAVRAIFLSVGLASIILLGIIAAFLFMEGLPILEITSVKEFILGTEWYPTDDPPDFGIFPLIVASAAVTVGSSAIAVPLGVLTAIYLAECASSGLRQVVKPMVELLAALPSVVLGFFGMVVLAPFLQRTFDLPTGLNLFNASLMLALMSVPTICSISEDAVYSVPTELKEASLALGATHWETIWRVVLPASLSGITTAVILGMSRAMGETMVVLMVAGGAAMIPGSLFDPVRPMPATIAAEMAEAPFRGDHYHALFAIAVVLFLFTLLFNLVAEQVSHRYKQVGASTL
jgi:phosphate transport system permease protein